MWVSKCCFILKPILRLVIHIFVSLTVENLWVILFRSQRLLVDQWVRPWEVRDGGSVKLSILNLKDCIKKFEYYHDFPYLQVGKWNYVQGHMELSLFHQILDPSNMIHPKMQPICHFSDEIYRHYIIWMHRHFILNRYSW